MPGGGEDIYRPPPSRRGDLWPGGAPSLKLHCGAPPGRGRAGPEHPLLTFPVVPGPAALRGNPGHAGATHRTRLVACEGPHPVAFSVPSHGCVRAWVFGRRGEPGHGPLARSGCGDGHRPWAKGPQAPHLWTCLPSGPQEPEPMDPRGVRPGLHARGSARGSLGATGGLPSTSARHPRPPSPTCGLVEPGVACDSEQTASSPEPACAWGTGLGF